MAPPDIALCYGTRPQIIKAARLRAALAPTHRVLAVDTGQHYDYELNALLYGQLGVAAPDVCLDVGSGSHAEQLGAVLVATERVLLEHRPGAVMVIGDTNSTLGAALAAAKLRIPVVHVEAGLRADDALMAEELNRRAVDAVARLLCTPCSAASRRLERERPDALVVETGDVMYDVLLRQRDWLPSLQGLLPDGHPAYCFATLHRAELTDSPGLLAGVLRALAGLDLPVVLPLHPRTRAALASQGTPLPGRLCITPPVGYLEALALTRGAEVVVTDSGGLQREAYWLGTPCVTLRSETEWVETVAAGANRLLAPADAEARLADVVAERRRRGSEPWVADAYGKGDAAERIVSALSALRED